MDTPEEELLHDQHAKALSLLAQQRAVENEVTAKRQKLEAEVSRIVYALTGISATRLVSDVLFMVLGNLSRGCDLRSFCLTCTRWNQAFWDNLSVLNSTSKLWSVFSSFSKLRLQFRPIVAFSRRNPSVSYTARHNTSGTIHSVIGTNDVFIATRDGFWTAQSNSYHVTPVEIFFDDHTSFEYQQQYVSRDEDAQIRADSGYCHDVCLCYYAKNPVDLKAKWHSAQADLTWKAIVEDITDLIVTGGLSFLRNAPEEIETENPRLNEALQIWEQAARKRNE